VPFIVKCSTAYKNAAESEEKTEERITPSFLRTNIPHLRERTVKNKRRWWIAPGWTDCWWMKTWNEEVLSLIFFILFPVIRHLGMG